MPNSDRNANRQKDRKGDERANDDGDEERDGISDRGRFDDHQSVYSPD